MLNSIFFLLFLRRPRMMFPSLTCQKVILGAEMFPSLAAQTTSNAAFAREEARRRKPNANIGLEKLVHFVRSVVWGGCNSNLNLSEIIWWVNRQRQQKVWLTSTQRGHASHSHVCHFQRKRLWCNKSLTQDLDLWFLIYVLFDLVPKKVP